MSDQPVLFSRAAASCRLTLNREDKCHAINEEMIESLDHYLNEIENDTTLRLVELTATGDKFFCAGGDIKSWSAYSPLDMGRKWIKRGNDVFNRLRNLPQLTVANLNGHTIGGGIELALCCDIRIARPGAKFSNPEVMLGMVPGWMGIERVLNQVGPVVGRQMLMLGKRLTAQEACWINSCMSSFLNLYSPTSLFARIKMFILCQTSFSSLLFLKQCFL